MNIYYVYAYLRKSDNSVYYIGKGKDNRAFVSHKNIGIPEDKTRIVLLETNLSEIGALALERRMIRWYGRKDLGTGILRNKTDGGDGSNPGLDTIQKIKSTMKGMKRGPMSESHKSKIRYANLGKVNSLESNQKRSKTAMGRKQTQVFCPHCNKFGGIIGMKRYHFDNCTKINLPQ